MKQRPPVGRNIAAGNEVLGLPARDVRNACRGRRRTGAQAADVRRGRLVKIRTHRATGDRQCGGGGKQMPHG